MHIKYFLFPLQMPTESHRNYNEQKTYLSKSIGIFFLKKHEIVEIVILKLL